MSDRLQRLEKVGDDAEVVWVATPLLDPADLETLDLEALEDDSICERDVHYLDDVDGEVNPELHKFMKPIRLESPFPGTGDAAALGFIRKYED